MLLNVTYGFKKSLSITLITKGSQGYKTEVSVVLYIVFYAPGIYKLNCWTFSGLEHFRQKCCQFLLEWCFLICFAWYNISPPRNCNSNLGRMSRKGKNGSLESKY